MWTQRLATLLIITLLYGCGGGDGTESAAIASPPPATPPTPGPTNILDQQLRALVLEHELTGDPSTGRVLPVISDPLAQLGMKLFYTKALGGNFDSACVSCHHPVLGGSDALSLSFGVGAINPDLLGPGRGDVTGIPNVPRNAPTTFNVGLFDSALFFDSRVESLGKEAGQNGAASGINTPDSDANVIDGGAGDNLVAAQARFPVTSAEEMRAALEYGQSNVVLRAHLAARIGNYGTATGEIGTASWLAEFQSAFASAESAEGLITFDNIALAISEYERSQIFVASPWRAYVQGDDNAISDNAKEGAILFLTDADDGGASCVQCHSGDIFSDEEHHTIAPPQIGPGKGNGNAGMGDFGRENISTAQVDRFRFRTPSLLNVTATGPYMHSGAYASLQEVLRHYDNPGNAVDDFFGDGGWCQLEQFESVANCTALYPGAEQMSQQALNKIQTERNANDPAALPNINLNNQERDQVIAFLQTLTDPCVESRACLSPWIPGNTDAVDSHQLNAVDRNGDAL